MLIPIPRACARGYVLRPLRGWNSIEFLKYEKFGLRPRISLGFLTTMLENYTV